MGFHLKTATGFKGPFKKYVPLLGGGGGGGGVGNKVSRELFHYVLNSDFNAFGSKKKSWSRGARLGFKGHSLYISFHSSKPLSLKK